jgi:hypothetical protein
MDSRLVINNATDTMINQNGSDNSKMIFTQATDCIKTTHKNLNDDDVRTNSLVNSVTHKKKF